ncbi:Hypothetical predicted protein [Mytilus galloprovincialis]|uniref:Uncharacterized protein n=1 Tax=Mytilus galloprovincialis TaxID=29158 RepID=A0A8B6FB52_MYTGA|nr:Hypothetical predicted protein [Mytilus galloprovincialis]
MRAATSNFPAKSKFVHEEKLKLSYPRSIKSCPLCKAAGRPDRHFLSKCSFLPNSDRKYMVKARQIAGILDNSDDELSDVEVDNVSKPMHSVNRVQVRQSPYLDVFHTHYNTRLTIDSGATGNMLRASAAKRMGIEIKSSSQSAHQADGSSPLKVIGEVHTNFTRDGRELHFEGLVVETLDVDILAGIPFMEKNDISIRPAKRQVILGNNTVYTYGSVQNTSEHHTVRRAHVLRAPAQFTTIWPGDFLEMQLPSDICSTDDTFAIEPRLESHVSSMHAGKDSNVWPPPNLITSVAGRIRIPKFDTGTP